MPETPLGVTIFIGCLCHFNVGTPHPDTHTLQPSQYISIFTRGYWQDSFVFPSLKTGKTELPHLGSQSGGPIILLGNYAEHICERTYMAMG